MRVSALGLLALFVSAGASADVSLHLAGGAGLSYGGDTLAKITYTDGDETSVKAGGLLYINVGPSLEFTGTPFSVQSLVGYQDDSETAQNGDVRFDRTTLDTTLFYQAGSQRFGVGLAEHFSPSYHQSGFYSSSTGAYSPQVDASFNNASGVELEYQYRHPHSRIGLSLRAVSLRYKLDSLSADGNPVPFGKTNYDGSFFAAGFYFYL